MKMIAFVLVSIGALCSQQIVHGSPVNDLAQAIHKLTIMKNNAIESQAQELLVKAIAEELSNELKSSQKNEEVAVIQTSGVDIQDCGVAGKIVKTALFWVPQNNYGVLINCGIKSGCTQVRVEVPTGTVQTDVKVCYDQASGDFCLDVKVPQSCQPSPYAIPIPINIPIGPSGKTGSVPGTLQIDIFGAQCIRIQLNLPKCP